MARGCHVLVYFIVSGMFDVSVWPGVGVSPPPYNVYYGRAHINGLIHLHAYIYISIYMHVCICMCVHVCICSSSWSRIISHVTPAICPPSECNRANVLLRAEQSGTSVKDV